MRKFEIILTFKPRHVKSITLKEAIIKQQRIFNIELEDDGCISPEQFCNNVINPEERAEIARINITENMNSGYKPLNWLIELAGRLYLFNGVPLVFHRN